MWSSLVALLSIPAHAYIYAGNPDVTAWVSRPASDLGASSADLDFVREHLCGGGTVDVQVDENVDLLDGITIAIPAGNLCALSFHWASAVTTAKSGAWTVSYTESATWVDVSAGPDAYTPLTPFVVNSGTFSGDAPRLVLSID